MTLHTFPTAAFSVWLWSVTGSALYHLAAHQVLNRFAAFTPVGFYYKAFHTPRRLFPFYENRIRHLAGLGAVRPDRTYPHKRKDYDFCDVLVVGAGPAGALRLPGKG